MADFRFHWNRGPDHSGFLPSSQADSAQAPFPRPRAWRSHALLRLALPGLGNLWLNLLKDTALVSVIALNDLMRMASVAVGVTKQPFLFYLAVSLLYWLLCVLSEAAIGRLEQHLSRGLRRPAL